MKRLPLWIILITAVVAALLIVVGYRERADIGYVPLILGVVWALFTLGAAKNVFADDD